MRKNIPDAKGRILTAAKQIFAEKGFDGARIDEVAKMAGVPKSLIYYHFKSKQEILDVMLRQSLEEYKAIITPGINESHNEKTQAIMDRKDHYAKFMEEHADVMRIILLESLKKSNKKPIIYRIVNMLVDTEEALSGIARQENYNRQERLVAEFFTNIIPNFAFACFNESWAEYFAINLQTLKDLFIKIFMETHGAYHDSHD